MDEKLIEFVRSNRCLFDKKHGGYKNQIYKDRLWLQFSKETSISVDTLKKRWKSIRDRFYRVQKTKNKEAASGSGSISPDTKQYKYTDSLLFLMDVDSSNDKTTGNFEPDEEIPYDLETPHFMDLSGVQAPITSPEPNKKRKSNAVECELLNTMKTVRESIERKSAFRLFLDSIALSVEEANCDVSQISRLQMGILQIVQNEINT